MSQRHPLRVWCLVIIAAVLLVSACSSPSPRHNGPVAPVDGDLLVHKVGVYARYGALPDLNNNRLQLSDLLMAYQPQTEAQRNRQLQGAGVHIIDSWVEQTINSTYCPAKPTECAVPSGAVQQALLQKIRQHVALAKSSGLVTAYYLTDDFRINLRGLLPTVRRIIRTVDPAAPTVCGLALPLSYRYRGSATAYTGTSRFHQALINYSPAWCDAVAIYSYGPTTPTPIPVQIDWTMAQTVPAALRALRAAGWTATPYSLIGVPQAFGYWPRLSIRGRKLQTPQFRQHPSTESLAGQIAAFCKFGAGSIIGYVWNDGSAGTVADLSNSPSLQAGFKQGIQTCRTDYWDR